MSDVPDLPSPTPMHWEGVRLRENAYLGEAAHEAIALSRFSYRLADVTLRNLATRNRFAGNMM